MANQLRIRCPHCDESVEIDFNVEALQSQRKGPAPYDPGPEVDAFVINKIEDKDFSFRTVGELLREKGVLTAAGGTKWSASTVRSLYLHALARREERQQAKGE